MKRRKFLQVFLAVATLLTAQLFAQDAKPKYIFLMIGDGMGVTQIAAASKYLDLTQPDAGGLLWEKFPVKGLTTTHPAATDKITDSAAAATAIACGVKTKNGMIGMTADNTAHRSVAYAAKDKGMKVAIITSVGINHATPAAFYSTRMSRGMYNEIGLDIASSAFDFFAGEPLLGKKPDEGRAAIKSAGYTIVNDREKIINYQPQGKTLIEHPIPYRVDAKEDSLRLTDFMRAGLKSLSDSEKGFFCMVEAGKIDWMGHANDIASSIGEVLDLNDTMAVVYDFYKKHPRETLIVVTGDHETGGMSFNFTANFDPKRFVAAVDGQKYSSTVLAGHLKGWRKEKLSNDEIIKRCLDAFGLSDVTPEEQAKLKKNVGERALLTVCQNMVAQRCGVTWTSFNHSSASVKTTAIGPGSELFAGDTDNTDIAKNIFKLLN
ncbi:MAG: alkaline phosphatase [Kiritimatiellae bacterium]|nr:alkaline phosphatase [Kiritimatiellia bacterium]